jgi:hypothetical protein
MATFDEVWRELGARLSEGTEIPNWSYDHGYTGKVTRIERVYYDSITVSGDRTTKHRAVPGTDFKKVFEFWDRYKQGLIPRDDIQEISRNSTYIFSLLHWLEQSEGIQNTL